MAENARPPKARSCLSFLRGLIGRAQRDDTESRLSANVKEGLLEVAYRHSELKISNAFYKFGYLHIGEWASIVSGSLAGKWTDRTNAARLGFRAAMSVS
jgi:hypothetical protein